MVEILGVVKLAPVPTKLPAVGASYQFNVPVDTTACKVNVPVSHRLAPVVEVIVGVVFTVANTAVLEDVHVPFAPET